MSHGSEREAGAGGKHRSTENCAWCLCRYRSFFERLLTL
jgi:hypothetical protein